MLDPTKELQAAAMAIENGLSTREQEAIKLNGSEFTANIDKLAIENEKMQVAFGNPKQESSSEFTNSLTKFVETVVKTEVKKQNEEE